MMKRLFAIVCSLVLLLSFSVSAFAAPVNADAQSVKTQAELIYSNFSSFRQNDDDTVWSYAVTDLDHNGHLELLAASVQGSGRYTTLKVWEVGEDHKSFAACNVNVKEGDSFPDVIANSADTYYVSATDTWHYMFDDSITVSATEVVAARCSVQMKNGNLSYTPYAYQQTEYRGSLNVISFTDRAGRLLTPEDYNSAVANAFAGAQKFSTNFDWFLASEATDDSRFSASYAIFSGDVVPVRAQAVSDTAPASTPVPATASQQNSYLMVTKNPTNESRKPGDTALFIANANNWASITWTFSAPSGGEYSVKSFASQFPKASVTGESGTTLSIKNVTAEMNGWSVYATFYSKSGQTVRTNTAFLYVSENGSKTTPVSNSSISGVVTNPMMSTVTITLSNGQSVQVSRGICSVVYGDLVTGCSCTVYYSGNTPKSNNIYHVDIYGSLTGYTTYYYEYLCPNCHGVVSETASVCPHCGYRFTESPSYSYYCPNCAHSVPGDAEICSYCGYVFATGTYAGEYYCPNCNGAVAYDEDVCPHCGYHFATGTGTVAGEYYCPNCNGAVAYDEDVCPHCGYIFATGGNVADSSESSGGVDDDVTYCPGCYNTISIYTDICPYCGYDFNGGYVPSGYDESDGGYAGFNYYENESTSDYSYYDYTDSSYSTGGVADDVKGCPNCYNSVSINAATCPYCGYDFYGGYNSYSSYETYDSGSYDYSYDYSSSSYDYTYDYGSYDYYDY